MSGPLHLENLAGFGQEAGKITGPTEESSAQPGQEQGGESVQLVDKADLARADVSGEGVRQEAIARAEKIMVDEAARQAFEQELETLSPEQLEELRSYLKQNGISVIEPMGAKVMMDGEEVNLTADEVAKLDVHHANLTRSMITRTVAHAFPVLGEAPSQAYDRASVEQNPWRATQSNLGRYIRDLNEKAKRHFEAAEALWQKRETEPEWWKIEGRKEWVNAMKEHHITANHVKYYQGIYNAKARGERLIVKLKPEDQPITHLPLLPSSDSPDNGPSGEKVVPWPSTKDAILVTVIALLLFSAAWATRRQAAT